MIDESFHLTPVDIRRYDFGRATIRGYDAAKVEAFRDQVAKELEDLIRSNQDLDSKAKANQEQLRAFRERDKALNEALVSAQQLRSEIREQAEREANLILREARAEADRMMDEARNDLRKLDDEVASLEKSRRAFIGQFRALAERQLSELDAAESAPLQRDAQPARSEPVRPMQKTPAWLDSLVKE